ncbi:MAG: protein-disulfide reductase DsbD N-terminal domain-containing protein [Pseudomonadales bacterium]|nr:protein-disulfide reductase DsbD N-terminal domain-containing protein [Pseudomonadales bacterium]
MSVTCARPGLMLAALLLGAAQWGQGAELPLQPAPAPIPLSPPVTADSPFASQHLTAPLPVDEAFALTVIVELPETIIVQWQIREGYYLYRKSLDFSESGSSGLIGRPVIPGGVAIADAFFGDVDVYYGATTVKIPIEDRDAKKIELLVTYQGCAEIGFCYPVQQRAVTLDLF